MRCPLRMHGFDQPDECDMDCAWLVRVVDLRIEPPKKYLACAVAVDVSDVEVPKGPANWIEER